MMLTRILLKDEQALFPEYHAQVAGASAVIAGLLRYGTVSSSRALGRLSQELQQKTQQGRSCKARTGVSERRCNKHPEGKSTKPIALAAREAASSAAQLQAAQAPQSMS
jgi:hypothetical protein